MLRLLLVLWIVALSTPVWAQCSNVDGASVNCDKGVTITSAADIANRRAQMINLAYGISTGILPSDQDPTVANVANPLATLWSPMNVGSVTRFEINGLVPASGYEVNPIYLWRPEKRDRNRLVILNGGHQNSCDWRFFGGEYNMQVNLRTFLAAGYSVLGVNQPGLGVTCAFAGKAHIELAQMLGPPMLKWFFEPNNQIINWLEKHTPFLDYSMTGISGGAWESNAYAAIDPRIHISIGVASGIPGLQFIPNAAAGPNYVDLVLPPDNPGGCTGTGCWAEAQVAPYYTIAGYMDQYVMGGFGYTPKYHLPRLHQQILGFFDSCCWGDYQWIFPWGGWSQGYVTFFSNGGPGVAQCVGGTCDYVTYLARFSKDVGDKVAELKGGGRGLPALVDFISNGHQISNCTDERSFTVTNPSRSGQLSPHCGNSDPRYNVAGYPDGISYIIAMLDANPPPTPAPAAGGFFGLLRRR